MNTETIYVLEHEIHGVVATGTAREIADAWLRDDGGDYYIEPKLDENDEQETLTVGGSKIWNAYIKESANRKFVLAQHCIVGETEEDAINDLLDDCFDGLNKSRSFSVMTKADHDAMQAEIAAQAAADAE